MSRFAYFINLQSIPSERIRFGQGRGATTWRLLATEPGSTDARTQQILDLFEALRPEFAGKKDDGNLEIQWNRSVADALTGQLQGSELACERAIEKRAQQLLQALGIELSPEQYPFWLVAHGLLRASRRKASVTFEECVASLRKDIRRSAAVAGSPPLSALNKTAKISALGRYWLWNKQIGESAAGTKPEWPPELLLAIILANTRENRDALDPIKSVLSAVGVPVKAWLLEYRERLYNAWGEETCEPILHKEYLERVADAMWKLSVSVFAHHTFSYETLAAQMRDPDVERVRRAVRRLAIVCGQNSKDTDKRGCPFWVGQQQWRWIVSSRSGVHAQCQYDGVNGIKEQIELLKA